MKIALTWTSLVGSGLLSTSTTAFTSVTPGATERTVLAANTLVNGDGSSSTIRTGSSELIQHRDEFDREAWINCFASVQDELCYQLDGHEFPLDLEGTFYQNGAAKYKVGDEIVIHPFDGDGMISAVTFHKGKAWYRNRFIETKGFLDELKANKVVYRGIFGTARNKGKWWSNILDANFKNVANTHVLYRTGDGRLFALWEGGLPHEVDPVTLETKGESDLDGTVKDLKRYAAHYKMDPTTGTICNFAVGPGKNDPIKEHTLFVMEHDADGNLLYQEDYLFPCVGINHDCAITDNYFVFFQTKASVDPLPFILGTKGIGQCFELDDNSPASTLVLVPRGPKTANSIPIEIEIPKTFTFHSANAFEDAADGTVVVDTVIADSMSMASDGKDGYPERPIWETTKLEDLTPYQLRRIRVDPNTQSFVSQTVLSQESKNVEFPVINPSNVGKPYQYAYLPTSPSDTVMSPQQGLAKVDVQQGRIVQKWVPDEPHWFLNEVSFVPRKTSHDSSNNNNNDEDYGYLVGYLMDGKAKTTSLVLFDAQNIAQGPIQTCLLKNFVPQQLHGTFVPGLVPEFTEQVAALYPPQR